MDHPRRTLGFLKLKKKIDINSLYGVKKLNNEFKTSIKLSSNIKKTGSYSAKIRLHREVSFDFPFEVIKEQK